jgi:hypothetical protein
MVSIDKIMAYENGEQTIRETVEMFAEMVKDGSVWQLQGLYGRTAKNLIDGGILDHAGNINLERLEEVLETHGETL